MFEKSLKGVEGEERMGSRIACSNCGFVFLGTVGRRGECCPKCGQESSIDLDDGPPSQQATALGVGADLRPSMTPKGTMLGVPQKKPGEEKRAEGDGRVVSISTPPVEVDRRKDPKIQEVSKLRPDRPVKDEPSVVVESEGEKSSTSPPLDIIKEGANRRRADNSGMATKPAVPAAIGSRRRAEMDTYLLSAASEDDFKWAQRGRKRLVAAVLILLTVLLPVAFYWFYIRH